MFLKIVSALGVVLLIAAMVNPLFGILFVPYAVIMAIILLIIAFMPKKKKDELIAKAEAKDAAFQAKMQDKIDALQEKEKEEN